MKMKSFLSLIICILFIVSGTVSAIAAPMPSSRTVAKPVTAPWTSEPADGEIRVVIDGKFVRFDQPPVIQDGRTLVPFRAILEAMGAEVYWDDDSQTVSAVLDENIISMTVGSIKAEKNGMGITLDVPPVIMNDRTLVPVRFIAESFGAAVDWDAETQTVVIAVDDIVQWLLIHREKLTANSIITKYGGDMYALDYMRVPEWKPVAGIITPNGSFVIVNDIIISIDTDRTGLYPSEMYRSDLNGENSKILDTKVSSFTSLWVYGNKVIFERVSERKIGNGNSESVGDDDSVDGDEYEIVRDGYYFFNAENWQITRLYESENIEFIACDDNYAYFKSPQSTEIIRAGWDGTSPSVKLDVNYPDSIYIVENGYYYLATENYNTNEFYVERYSIYDGERYEKFGFSDSNFLGIHGGYIYFSSQYEIGRMSASDDSIETLAAPPPGVYYKSVYSAGFIDGYLYLIMYWDNNENTAAASLFRIPQSGGELEYMGADWTVYYE